MAIRPTTSTLPRTTPPLAPSAASSSSATRASVGRSATVGGGDGPAEPDATETDADATGALDPDEAGSTSVADPKNPIGTGQAKLLNGDTQEQDNALQQLKYDAWALNLDKAQLADLKANGGSADEIAKVAGELAANTSAFVDHLNTAGKSLDIDAARVRRYMTGGAHPVPDTALIPDEDGKLDAFAKLLESEMNDIGEAATGVDLNKDGKVAGAAADASKADGTESTTKPDTEPSSAGKAGDLADPLLQPSIKSFEGVKYGAPKFTLFPNGTPSPKDVNQQQDSEDCYYFSALTSMAATPEGQKTIQKAIAGPAADGTYQVAMHDPDGKPISVAVDPKNLPIYNNGDAAFTQGADGGANWANVMESAWAKYNDVYRVAQGQVDASATGYDAIQTDVTDDLSFMEALTGTDGASYLSKSATTDADQLALAQTMAKQLGAGMPVTAYNYGLPNLSDAQWQKLSDAEKADAMQKASDASQAVDSSGDTIEAAHAYGVTSVDKGADGTYSVTLQNPWGSRDENGSGKITMSMAEYVKLFESTNLVAPKETLGKGWTVDEGTPGDDKEDKAKSA